ncbi:unnamed protein product [Prorocentrum cordatum]|uniref:Uncharacterized protein n=1 Tax=Prorocentrum cordatum TaxID=2364126 RepID=A0ABN9YFN7_9DINO|nr:unnamed protein product [Polarella glacialis]
MVEKITSLQCLALPQDAHGRELAAALFGIWLCPSSAKCIRSGKEAIADYQKAVKDKREGPRGGTTTHAGLSCDDGGDEGGPGGEVVSKWLRMANGEKGQEVVNETFQVCYPKDAHARQDQPEDHKKTKVTMNLNKWADFRAYEAESMQHGISIKRRCEWASWRECRSSERRR